MLSKHYDLLVKLHSISLIMYPQGERKKSLDPFVFYDLGPSSSKVPTITTLFLEARLNTHRHEQVHWKEKMREHKKKILERVRVGVGTRNTGGTSKQDHHRHELLVAQQVESMQELLSILENLSAYEFLKVILRLFKGNLYPYRRLFEP